MTSTETFIPRKKVCYLTPVQREIISHLAEGHSLKEIAVKMNRKTHRGIASAVLDLQDLFEVKNIPHLVATAIKQGII